MNWFSRGLAHLHPGTSWSWFRETEGLGANLDNFLEQVGTWIWEKNSMRYPSHGPFEHILNDQEVIIDFPLEAQFRDGRTLKSRFCREPPLTSAAIKLLSTTVVKDVNPITSVSKVKQRNKTGGIKI